MAASRLVHLIRVSAISSTFLYAACNNRLDQTRDVSRGTSHKTNSVALREVGKEHEDTARKAEASATHTQERASIVFDDSMRDLASARSFLLGPKVELDAGCGGRYEIVIPPGEIAASTLVNHKDLPGLRMILANGSIEAQVLALRSLVELGALDAHDRNQIALLRRSNKRVRVCAGDIGGRTLPVQDYLEW